MVLYSFNTSVPVQHAYLYGVVRRYSTGTRYRHRGIVDRVFKFWPIPFLMLHAKLSLVCEQNTVDCHKETKMQADDSRLPIPKLTREDPAEMQKFPARMRAGSVHCRSHVAFFVLFLFCCVVAINADTDAPHVTDLVIEPLVGDFPSIDVRTTSQIVTFVSYDSFESDFLAPVSDFQLLPLTPFQTVSVTDNESGINRVSLSVAGHQGSDRTRGVSEVYDPCRTSSCGVVNEVIELGKTRILGAK